MFSLFGDADRLCDSLSRRELLTVGGLSLLGMGLPDVLRRQAHANPGLARAGDGFGNADSVVLVYLQGSPSHIDLWDPKPNAPAGIRGEFQPIAARSPGVFLGEVLPMLAEQSPHYTVVRSIGVDPKGLRNHGAAIYMLMTGSSPTNFSPTGLAVPPSRRDLPSVGACVAKYRPARRGDFSNVALCGPVKEGRVDGVGQSAGLLGAAYDPYSVYDDPTKPLQLEGFTLPAEVTLDRLQSRVDLREVIEKQGTRLAQAASGTAMPGSLDARVSFDAFYEEALSLIQANRAVRAFRLDEESPRTRERYGATRFGQSLLLARRLIEAQTRFVQVTWPARSSSCGERFPTF